MKTEPQAEIGYLLKGFARTSETFISNEIHLLEEAGVRISIFSFKKLEGQQRHGVSQRIKAPVTYLPEPTPFDNIGLLEWIRRNAAIFSESQGDLLKRRPGAYLRTLLAVLAMSFRYAGGSFKSTLRSLLKEFFQAGFIASEVLKSGRIEHLHAHFCHTATTVAMLASRLSGIPFSFTAHAKDIYRRDMNPGDLLSRKLRAAKFAVTCTKANSEYLGKLANTELHTIYHGLDLTLFAPAERTVATGPPLILAVGRFVEKKGFIYLVEACRRLKDEGMNFRCQIIGGFAEHAERIQELIDRLDLKDTVSLHHAVTQEELKKIYETASLFVLPCVITDDGDRDGIPNVMVEALAMGLPVVSTSVSGIPELIRDRKTGLLVPPKDPQALAKAIRELIENPALGSQLAQNGRELVLREFDAKRNTLALKKLFDLQPCSQKNEEPQ